MEEIRNNIWERKDKGGGDDEEIGNMSNGWREKLEKGMEESGEGNEGKNNWEDRKECNKM